MSYLDSWYQGLGTIGQDYLKATLGPTVAILTFVLTNIIQIIVLWISAHNKKKGTVVGIYKEIKDNLEYGIKTLSDNVINDIKQKIDDEDEQAKLEKRSPMYRPLVGITESSAFYEAVSPALTSIKRKSLVTIANYCRSVTDQKQVAAAIEGPSFLCIGVASRRSMMDELWTAFRESTEKGAIAIMQLRQQYPTRWFRDL